MLSGCGQEEAAATGPGNAAGSGAAAGQKTIRLGVEGSNGYVPVAKTPQDLTDYLKAEDAFDSVRMRSLTKSGRVTLLDKGARAVLVPKTSGENAACRTVQLLEGPLSGSKAVVPQEFVPQQQQQ